MEFLSALADRWVTTVAWLAGLGAAFAVLARLFPCNPGMYWWKDRRAVVTDLVYWFLVPLVLLFGRGMMLVAAALLLFGGPPPASAVAAWPFWVQVAAALLFQDVLIYWLHRLFHTRPLWPFHAVHHSPHVLDWTAMARFHPVNQLLEFAVADVVVLLMGFPPVVLLAAAPFNLVYSAMVHANLNWTFGPLRYVFASPVFHRWHHTSEAEGLDKNFAPTFPFLDVIFGTFHMPAGKRPEVYGAGEPAVPAGFWGQFVHPFRGWAPVRWAVQKPGLAMVAAGLVGGLVLCGWAEVSARLAPPVEPKQADRRRWPHFRVVWRAGPSPSASEG